MGEEAADKDHNRGWCRADAIRWVLARFRRRPAYARLRERVREIDRLRAEF